MTDSFEKEKQKKLKVSDDADQKSLPSTEKEQVPEVSLLDPDSDLKLDPRYTVKSTLGKGGMSTVYLVHDKKIDKTLALKLLNRDLASDQAAVKRFLQEAESAGALDHENIVSMYETGRTEDGRPFILMDYVEGENLAQVLAREGPLDTQRAFKVLDQILDGLSHAHNKGLIHRDLKPSNIIMNSEDRVFLVDFGIAKIQEGDIRKTQDLTQTGSVIGSPEYMSPEQCLNVQIDKRSDIYSLGCVMYKMFTGKTPFSGSNAIQIIAQHLNDSPVALSDHSNVKVTPDLEAVISTCLEKSPDMRYKTVDELAKDLKAIQSGSKPNVARRMIFTRRSKPVLPVTASILALISWVVLGLSINGLADFTDQKARANTIVQKSNSISKIFYDAGVAMGAYSITKSPLFSDRYSKLTAQLKEDLEGLKKLGNWSPIEQKSVDKLDELATSGIKILSEAKVAIDNDKVDVAQFRTRHMYKEVRSLADKIQDELRATTNASQSYLDKVKNKSPMADVILSGIFCLLMNIACVLSILFYKRTRK